MSDTNIDKFNDLAGKIFAELYEHFPIPYDLVAKKLATPTFTSEGNDLCLLELPASDAVFFNATVRWLIGTGYLTGEICPDTQVSGAVLTLKGLEALKSTPHCLTHGLSIRQRLAETMKEGSKETLKSVLAEEIALGAKLITPVVEIL